MIQLENHRSYSYRKVGAPPKPKPRAKHPYKVMVWAGISKKGATSICIINGSVDAVGYQEILSTHLVPFLNTVMPRGQFQQDNAPAHTAKSMKTFLLENHVRLF
jgi:hypothetical protein